MSSEAQIKDELKKILGSGGNHFLACYVTLEKLQSWLPELVNHKFTYENGRLFIAIK